MEREAFEKLRNGAKMLSDAVSVTMGAKRSKRVN